MPENAITTKLNYKMCTGCSACVSTCPVSALRMEPDEYGYYKAVLDRDKCTNCGKCTTICPAFNKLNNDNKTLPDCFEFVALEEKKLKSSSSGGAFTVLAEEFISWGGCVAGAAWTEDFRAEHIIIDKAEDIYKLQKSKYLQSDLNDIFLRIEKKLEDNVPVLFSGCPCQVAGLKAFLNKDYDNLLLVDILCSYSPSPMFFRKYLEDSFPGGISAYEFRHKKNISSWDCTTVKITKKDGLETVVNGGGQDDFQRVFHNKIMIPPHCEKCRFQNYPRTGDITLGDFWGIEKHDPQAASKGVSVILSNNKKGQYFLDFISDYKIGVMKKVPLDWIGLNGNRERASFSGIIPKRDMFYDAIKRMSFSGAVNYATKSNHGIYKNPGNVSLPPLAFSRRINTFHFDHAVWDMHFINNATVLTVYPKKSAPGNFAVLPLNCTLKNNTTYTLNIRFKVKTESPVLNFHIKDSGSGYWQIIHTFKTAHDSADKWNELKVDFIPRSNIYDEFMIGASQICGESNFVCFDHIFVTEKN